MNPSELAALSPIHRRLAVKLQREGQATIRVGQRRSVTQAKKLANEAADFADVEITTKKDEKRNRLVVIVK